MPAAYGVTKRTTATEEQRCDSRGVCANRSSRDATEYSKRNQPSLPALYLVASRIVEGAVKVVEGLKLPLSLPSSAA